MLIALKSVHKAHSMSYDHGMRYTIVKIYSMGSPNGCRPTHIMCFHDVNKQIVQTLFEVFLIFFFKFYLRNFKKDFLINVWGY